MRIRDHARHVIGNAVAPEPRTGSDSPRLDETEFKRRFRSQFQDPAFDALGPELDRIADPPWHSDAVGGRSHHQRPADPSRLRAMFPDTDSRLLGGFLVGHITIAIRTIRPSHAAPDHLAVHVQASSAASGHGAAIAISADGRAADRPSRQNVGQGLGCGRAASERSAALPAFGRVDAKQADALAGEVERVAVDDAPCCAAMWPVECDQREDKQNHRCDGDQPPPAAPVLGLPVVSSHGFCRVGRMCRADGGRWQKRRC